MTTPELLDSLGIGHLHNGRRVTQADLCRALGLPMSALSPSAISDVRQLALTWAVELWQGRVPVGIQTHTAARELALRIGRAVADLRGCAVPERVAEGEELWPSVRGVGVVS